MALPERAVDAVTIVIKGQFSTLLTPRWFHDQGLIGHEEFNEADVRLIAPPDAASFSMAWLRCEVRPEGLTLQTSDSAEFERTRDAAVSILQAFCTSISVMGINRQVHYSTQDAAQWHSVGDALTPKDVWDGILDLPGMRDVTMWGVRPDNYGGYIQVQVQPSMQVKNGVYVMVNDHFDLAEIADKPTSRADPYMGRANPKRSAEKVPVAIKILQDNWADSQQRAEHVIEKISRLGDSR